MIDKDRIDNDLNVRGVSAVDRGLVRQLLPEAATGVILYGSFARGDAGANSDVDLIAISDSSQSVTVDPTRLSLSFYTERQLQTASGSLFGAHLKRDGVILHDTSGATQQMLASMGSVDLDRLFERLAEGAGLLQLPSEGWDVKQRVRVARYFLRSSLYGSALRRGDPCFSVRDLAASLAEPSLIQQLSSHVAEQEVATTALFDALLARLISEAGVADIEFDSLENVVAFGDDQQVEMALFILNDSDEDVPYSESPTVLL